MNTRSTPREGTPWPTVLAALLSLASLCATGPTARAEQPKPTTPKGVAPKAPAGVKPTTAAPLSTAEVERRAQPVATFKGGQVTLGELEDTVAGQNAFMRNRYRDPKALQELLGRLVRFNLLALEAERTGWDKKKAVQEAVGQNAVQLMMKNEFDDKMSADSIPKADVEAYYKEHIDDYEQLAMQRASHVLVATEAEAKELLAQAKSIDVRAFRQLARDKSIDEATKAQGGDLHYFDEKGTVRGENASPVDPAIAKVAFALKNVGDTAAKPIKVPSGYSIVKLTGSRPRLSRKLAEVQETIRAKLWRERREQAVEAFVAKLREANPPEVHPALIETIKLDPPPDKPAAPASPVPGTEESRLEVGSAPNPDHAK
jgi:peptidyl-prolyl cis-trans isomerase C